MRRVSLVVVSMLTVAAVVTGCTAPPEPEPDPEPSAPAIIAGDGVFDLSGYHPSVGFVQYTYDVTFSLPAVGEGVYVGSLVGDSIQDDLSISTSGHDIVGVDLGVVDDESITNVTTVMDSHRCPETPALRVEVFMNSGSGSGMITLTICDPVAAEWFG